VSLQKLSQRGLAPRKYPGVALAVPWVRNPSWLAITAPLTTDEKVVGLYAVYEAGANLVAVNCAGAYTVNWGDGSGNINTASGVNAERDVLWSGAPTTSDVGIASALAVTFTAAGATVNLTAHGFSNRQQVAFSTIVSTTGISTYTTYFVVGVTTNTFQVSATYNGSAITLTTDGSGSVYVPKYRQVIITITMQSAGTFTDCNLHVKHSLTTATTQGVTWLDLAISGSLLVGVRVGNALVGTAGTSVLIFSMLEQFNLVNSNITAFGYMLQNCYELRSIAGLVTSTMTPKAVTAVTFTAAGSLVNWTAHGLVNGTPVMLHAIVTSTGISIRTNYFVVGSTTNTFQLATTVGGTALTITTDGSGTASAGVSMSHTFYYCYSLQTVPLFNTASVTDMTYMFYNCLTLQTVPLFNTAAVTNMFNMFSYCYALQTVPLFNTAAVTYMSSMFNGCYALQTVPLFNTAAVTYMSNMFSYCYALQTVPLFNTAAVVGMYSMFANCYSLQTVPLFNTAAVTNMSNMFYVCQSLQTVPLFNTAAVTNMSSMFSACYSLQTVPLFNTASVTDMSNMLNSCYSLVEGALSGTVVSISYASCKLSAAALNRIYTALGTAAAFITVSLTPGTTADTKSIATAKSWTVTG
jgi:surface protein